MEPTFTDLRGGGWLFMAPRNRTVLTPKQRSYPGKDATDATDQTESMRAPVAVACNRIISAESPGWRAAGHGRVSGLAPAEERTSAPGVIRRTKRLAWSRDAGQNGQLSLGNSGGCSGDASIQYGSETERTTAVGVDGGVGTTNMHNGFLRRGPCGVVSACTHNNRSNKTQLPTQSVANADSGAVRSRDGAKAKWLGPVWKQECGSAEGKGGADVCFDVLQF